MDNTTLVNLMANFFMNKVHKINDALESNLQIQAIGEEYGQHSGKF